jgi:hypothetical protein
LQEAAPGDGISFVKTFLDNILFVTPYFQIIFKLTQSFFKDLSVEQIRLILRA